MAAETMALKQISTKLVGDHPTEGQVKAGKWAYVIDNPENPVLMTFIRHRDVNIIESFNPHQMANSDTLRLAILGSLRYGKPLVLDLADDPAAYDACATKIDAIQNGLMQQILDKSIMQNKKFMALVKDTDDSAYKEDYCYLESNFKFIIATTKPDIPSAINDKTYIIQIV